MGEFDKMLFLLNTMNSKIRSIEAMMISMESYMMDKGNLLPPHLLEPYREIRTIMPIKKLKDSIPFVRIGSKGDGGYVMLNDFEKTSRIAYSFGISSDVSWDDDMANRGFDVYMYDHAIQGLPKERKEFHWKKKGIGGCKENNLDTLENLMEENKHSNTSNMILKMDVEGAEYEWLRTVKKDTMCKFNQIAIEMHFLNIRNIRLRFLLH